MLILPSDRLIQALKTTEETTEKMLGRRSHVCTAYLLEKAIVIPPLRSLLPDLWNGAAESGWGHDILIGKCLLLCLG